MTKSALLVELRMNLQAELTSKCSEILSQFPLNEYVTILTSFPKNSNYDKFSVSAMKIFQSMTCLFEQKIIADYHKLVLLLLIEGSVDTLSKKDLPARVYYIYFQTVWNIIQKIKDNQYPLEWFNLTKDKFCKELALCSLRMIPIGPRLIIKGHISPRFLLGNGIKQFFKGISCLVWKTKGLYPVFEFHMNREDPVLMSYFNEKGWNDMFFILAEIIARDKTIKAVIGNGWLYDPQVTKISPNLGFIWSYANSIGAQIFRVNSDEEALHNALFQNPKRQKLYSEGKYIPTNYIAIFPRENIIQWVSKQNKLIGLR